MKHTTKTADGHLQKELPDIIYLQLHGDSEYVDNIEEIDFGDVTWSEDRIYPTDVEYAKVKSPWISVKERLPNNDNNVLVCNNRSHFVGIANYYKKPSTWGIAYSGSEIRGVTHWCPIPSFDEILEANKDVLERIKQKED